MSLKNMIRLLRPILCTTLNTFENLPRLPIPLMEKPPDSGYYGDFLRMDVPVTGWIIYGSKIIFYVLK